MTEQNHTPDIAGDDTEGHAIRGETGDDDTEGHMYR